MNQYRLEAKKGDGTFSEVFKASSIEGGQTVAIKCMKKKYDTIEKIKKLPEIQALKLLSPHDHIIKLIEVLYDEPTGKLALVFELMEQNLYEFLVNNKNINPMKIKYFMFSLLKAIVHTHSKGIFHRDIKPENVLISKNNIKLADFGSCKGIYTKHPYTEYISTRWYRAPECLMTDGYYSEKMDLWGYGCVLFQMTARYPLFNGKNELDQIHKINKILGTPSEKLLAYFKSYASHMKPEDWNFPKHKGIGFARLLPNSPKELIDLLGKLLAYDAEHRISAEEALAHPYFQDLSESSRLQKFNSTLFGETLRDRIRLPIKPTKNEDPHRGQNNSLPPIHHIKMDLNVNLFRETVNSKFKKTHWQYKKKKEER